MFKQLINSLKEENQMQQLIKLIFVLSIALFVFLFGWNEIIQTNAYYSFNGLYNDFTVKIIQTLGSLQQTSISYISDLKIVSTEIHSSKLVLPVEAYKYFFIGFILLLLVPFKHWISSISVIIFVLLFVAIRAALITFIFLFFKNTIHISLLVWVETTIFLVVLLMAYYISSKNIILLKLSTYIESKLADKISINLFVLIFLLIIVPPFPRVLFTYIDQDILPSISNFILKISSVFLSFIGQNATVIGEKIFLDNNWVHLKYPCIGIGVFTIVATLILAIRGKLIIKFLYLFILASIYITANSLRLAILLYYINQTYKEIGLNKPILHDNVTIFMYFVAFAGFLVYFFWFQDLNFNKMFRFIKRNKIASK